MPDTFGRMKVIRVSSGCVNVILCLIGLAILGGFEGAGTLNFVPTHRMNKHLEKYHVAKLKISNREFYFMVVST